MVSTVVPSGRVLVVMVLLLVMFMIMMFVMLTLVMMMDGTDLLLTGLQ